MTTLRIIIGGEEQPCPLPEAPETLSVGSGESCNVVVSDPSLDPLHLVLEKTPAGIRVTDQGSRGGTKLNGLYVSQALVKGGDEIAAGAVRIVVVEGSPGAAPSAPVAAPPVSAPTAPAAPRPAGAPRAPLKAPARPPAPKKIPLAMPGPKAALKPGTKLSSSAPRADRRPPGKSKKVWFLVVGGVGLALLMVLLFKSSGESARLEMARGAYLEAQALWDRGDLDRAERGFTAMLSTYPDAPDAGRAQKAIEQIHAARKRERDAHTSREELAERWNQLTFEQLGEEYRDWRPKWTGTAAEKDEQFLPGLRAKYDAEGKRRFRETRARASKLLGDSRYYDAILVWHEYLYVPQIVPPDLERATGDFELIQRRAREDYATLAMEADALIEGEEFEKATALLSGRLPDFRGTRHAFAIRQKLEVVDILGQGETVTAAVVEERISHRQEFLRAAEDAESLATRRLYEEAVAVYRRAADECPHEDLTAEFRARADQLADLAELFGQLRSQIENSPERFRGIDLGHGLKANAVGADKKRLRLNIRGAQSDIAWDRMGPERLLPLMERLDLSPGGNLSLARYAFGAGYDQVGHEAVTKALRRDETLEEEAFELLARARGIPVPEGGFVLFQKRWLTLIERAEAELKEEIALACREARSSDQRRRDAALDRLRGIGAPARRALIETLNHLRGSVAEEVAALPVLRDPATKGMLFQELTARRKAALALIFDTVKYPYPHPPGPEYDQVQAEVDVLVEAVRLIWTRPVALLMDRSDQVRDLLSRVEDYSLELARLGSPPEVSHEELVGQVNAAIDMPHFTPDSKSKNNLEWSEKVLAYNETVEIEADGPERDCVNALNGYRMMMGFRAVMWNDKLLAAGRAHSTHMKTHGYFAHNVPMPGAEHDPVRTPGLRTKRAGYTGGVSENIARGSQDGTATHWQWYRSSGHHRNLLGARHTEVGVGRDTDFWTQNFGSAKKKVD